MRVAVRLLVLAVGMVSVLGTVQAGLAQSEPIEITRADITKLNVLDASQWTVLGVRLGDTRDAALKTLQALKDVKTQEDPLAGRIYVVEPPTGTSVVMVVKVVENQVTTISVINTFGEWFQGDTKLFFKAFEDDSLRHKFLGREDNREVVRGGTKEAPTEDVIYNYFKEGIILHSGAKRSADGKQMERVREMLLIYPARVR
ncbi:MAG: hypothetical protein NTW68_03730 [candidate division NC10 bacterium]|nr:hypothetical protein [candidate division NC10 bacterium]